MAAWHTRCTRGLHRNDAHGGHRRRLHATPRVSPVALAREPTADAPARDATAPLTPLHPRTRHAHNLDPPVAVMPSRPPLWPPPAPTAPSRPREATTASPIPTRPHRRRSRSKTVIANRRVSDRDHAQAIPQFLDEFAERPRSTPWHSPALGVTTQRNDGVARTTPSTDSLLTHQGAGATTPRCSTPHAPRPTPRTTRHAPRTGDLRHEPHRIPHRPSRRPHPRQRLPAHNRQPRRVDDRRARPRGNPPPHRPARSHARREGDSVRPALLRYGDAAEDSLRAAATDCPAAEYLLDRMAHRARLREVGCF